MIFILLLLLKLPMPRTGSAGSSDTLRYQLDRASDDTMELIPGEPIFIKNGIIYCTGTSEAARANNLAAGHMAEGEYEKAIEVLEKALLNSALFFPFRYNLGSCYLNIDLLNKALIHFEKAKLIVPEFSRTYLQIGYICERQHRDDDAIRYFRDALNKNNRELDTFILIGNVFYKRGQLEMAQKYYDAALSMDQRFPNGLLGRAKIYFKREKYIRAIVLLRSIDRKKEYDISLHYFYAESAYKLQDYTTAAREYRTLLDFKTGTFFLEHSRSLIRHKLDLSTRFAEIEK